MELESCQLPKSRSNPRAIVSGDFAGPTKDPTEFSTDELKWALGDFTYQNAWGPSKLFEFLNWKPKLGGLQAPTATSATVLSTLAVGTLTPAPCAALLMRPVLSSRIKWLKTIIRVSRNSIVSLG